MVDRRRAQHTDRQRRTVRPSDREHPQTGKPWFAGRRLPRRQGDEIGIDGGRCGDHGRAHEDVRRFGARHQILPVGLQIELTQALAAQDIDGNERATLGID